MNKIGFGFLRLPMTADKQVDIEAAKRLVDRYMELGGRYFDTAYTYLRGNSETALREALVKRYPRDSYIIADKLPGYNVKTYADCRRYFNEQLERCGVEKFDVFMLHWLNADNYAIAEQQDEFRFLRELKEQGLADRIGFSYHDSPELLDEILTKHPCVDIVLLQINYLDWLSPALQAKACYDTAVRHGKQVIVMEPVKGGSLAALPEDVEALLKAADPAASSASWALRFAQSLDSVEIVLSGMNEVSQIAENMRDVAPITAGENEMLQRAAEMLRGNIAVGCTGCGYCLSHCPKNIAIPAYLALYNEYARTPKEGWKMGHAYAAIAREGGAASDCIDCKSCERGCPQKLEITSFLKKTAEAFN